MAPQEQCVADLSTTELFSVARCSLMMARFLVRRKLGGSSDFWVADAVNGTAKKQGLVTIRES